MSLQKAESQLRNWPVQIALLPLKAPYYEDADLLIAADRCAYAYGGFHGDFLKDHTLAIGCPKLDNANLYNGKTGNYTIPQFHKIETIKDYR